MKHELIKTENYLLVVDDEGITGLENNIWVIQGNRLFMWQNTMALVFSFKPKKIIAHLPLNEAPYLDGVDVLPKIENEVDVMEVFNMACDLLLEVMSKNPPPREEAILRTNQIKELNQPKLPIAFECEMIEYGQYDCGVFMKDDEELKTITNSEGRTEWVGKYLF